MKPGCTAAVLLVAAALRVSAQAPDRVNGSLPAINVAAAHLATQAPAIDGSNLDPVWRTAPTVSDFVQFAPTEGKEPSFRTEFQVAYDERNLYVYVRMYDPHPDSIMRALTRRDVRGPSDQIKIMIDSYNDGRTGYEFAVNPDGVKRDYAMFDDGSEDDSWNGVWDVATVVDSLGWTAEFRIPLSQLRYAHAETHTFGFGVWRDIERYKERVSWPAYSREKSGLVSQLGRLSGIAGLSNARRLEITPYSVTRNVSRARENGGFDREQQPRLHKHPVLPVNGRRLVNVHAETVADAVREVFAVSARSDNLPGGIVQHRNRRTRPHRPDSRFVRGKHRFVDPLLLPGPFSHNERPRNI